MIKRYKIKIIVLKRFSPIEVFNTSPVTPVKPLTKCKLFSDGQEFVVDEELNMPEGFCTAAWNTIYGTIKLLSFDGNLLGIGRGESQLAVVVMD